MPKRIKCSNCNGTGREKKITIGNNGECIVECVCELCDGTGYLKRKRKEEDNHLFDACTDYFQIVNKRDLFFELYDEEYY